MKTPIVAALIALALLPTALAGGEAHLTADANGDVHTVDVYVADDGTVTILVDGQPLSAPAVPEAPALPELPSPPALP